MLLVRIVRPPIRLFYKLFFGAKIKGAGNFPKNGGYIIASNHLSAHDPVILGAFISQRFLSFLAKQELFKNKLCALFLKYVGAVPVNRGTRDASAVLAAVEHLKAGNLLCIFPEGTRIRDGKRIKAKKGTVRIAELAGVPVVPVHIEGNYRLFGHTEIIVGEPIVFNVAESESDFEGKTEILMNAIYSLHGEDNG